jgi:DNA-binding FadR family transcriptional regulator
MNTENNGEFVRKVSLVEQIALQLRKEILTLVFPPDSEFPSEKSLSLRFGTSHMTVRGALKILSQEGFIEIAHGKRNIVKDFKGSVGIDILPELLVAGPDGIVPPEGFAIFEKHVFWLYDQILLSAAEKAEPEDKPELRKRVRLFTKAEGLDQIWNTQIDLVREMLRISDNIVLMMYFNSYVKTHQKLLTLGMIKSTVYPVPDYQKTLYKVIDAICANDKEAVRKIIEQIRPIAKQDIQLWYKNN